MPLSRPLFHGRYPINRELISINKRFHSPGHGKEYEFRQDWNSLIGQPGVPPVPKRTKDFFPQADVLADYIEDFARAQEDAGRILYNSSVDKVMRAAEGGGFVLRVKSSWYPETWEMQCGRVVMCNGLWTPKLPYNVYHGQDLMLGYDGGWHAEACGFPLCACVFTELPPWGPTEAEQTEWERLFTGKDIAILGTCDHL